MAKLTKGTVVTTTQTRCNIDGGSIPSGNLVTGRDEDDRGTVFLKYPDRTEGWQVNADTCTVVPSRIEAGMWVTTTQERCNFSSRDVVPKRPLKVIRGQAAPEVGSKHSRETILVEGDGTFNVNVASCTVVPEPSKKAEPEPKKPGWTFNVPLDEVDGMRILRELEQAGAKYASISHPKGYTTLVVHSDLLKEIPEFKGVYGGPITKVDKQLGTYDQTRFGPATKWRYVSKSDHSTFEKLKAAIEAAHKAKAEKEASKVRVTVEYGV